MLHLHDHLQCDTKIYIRNPPILHFSADTGEKNNAANYTENPLVWYTIILVAINNRGIIFPDIIITLK